jgi:hypothetical protein
VYLAWTDWRDGSNTHVYFARSVDAGRTFGPNVRVDLTRGSGPSLAIDDSGTVHISFSNRNPSGGYFTYYTKSTDGGQSFLPPVRACDSLHHSQLAAPSVAVSRSGRYVYVVRSEAWIDSYPPSTSQIKLSRSTDGGTTFLTPDVRVYPDTSADMYNPSVAVFNDSIVLVAWDSAMGLHTYFARSRNGGSSFEPTICLDTVRAYRGQPSVGVDVLGRVYVLETGLFLHVSCDTGASFAPPRVVPLGGYYPSLRVSPDGRLYIACGVGGVDPDVRFAFSLDGGNTFPSIANPCDSSYMIDQICPGVAANEQGKVFVAWSDYRNDPAQVNNDVYLATGIMTAITEDKPEFPERLTCTVSPNPAKGLVTVTYMHPGVEVVRAAVYDQTGREVVVLQEGMLSAGKVAFNWNGNDRDGRRVSTGVYFVMVSAPSGVVCSKLQYIAE